MGLAHRLPGIWTLWSPGTGWCLTPSLTPSLLGHLPVLLGGDHCSPLAPVSAVAQHCRRPEPYLAGRPCRLQHPQLSPSGNLHGMPVALPDAVWVLMH